MKERIKKIRTSQEPYMSQEKFAQKINLTRQFVALLESGDREPSDRTISDICRVFGVNETWLRTGNGEMNSSKGREQEMAELVKSLFNDSPESFRSALITTLLRFDPNGPEWEVLERIYEGIANARKPKN